MENDTKEKLYAQTKRLNVSIILKKGFKRMLQSPVRVSAVMAFAAVITVAVMYRFYTVDMETDICWGCFL